MKHQGIKFLFASLTLMTVFSFQGCGLHDSNDRSQLQVAHLSEPAVYVLECSLHIMKGGQSLFQKVQTSSRFEQEVEASKSIPNYTQSLEQSCEKSLAKNHLDALSICQGQLDASRAILCSTKKL